MGKFRIPNSEIERWSYMMARIQISNDPSGRIILSFPYDHLLVAKVKTIDGRRWHPVGKRRSFPNTVGLLLRGDCPRFTDGAKRSRRIRTVPAVAGTTWNKSSKTTEI